MAIASSGHMKALSIPAADIMSRPVFGVRDNAPVKEALQLLLEKKISGAPAIDSDGRPVGVVTLHDLARYAEWHLEAEDAAEEARDQAIAKELDRSRNLERRYSRGLGMHVDRMSRATVTQVMTPRVACVKKSATLKDVVRTLDELKVHRVFVTGARNKVVGVITTVDVMYAFFPSPKKTAKKKR